jgi:predicted RNA binding protein YcfA (HicA-like mRNA interferase family)
LRLPRDLSGNQLASLLRRFGYEPTRQTGSHLRLTSTMQGFQHHVTIPRHGVLKVGTLAAILADIAAYLEVDRQDLTGQLFGR